MRVIKLLPAAVLIWGAANATPVPASGDNKLHHIIPDAPDEIVKNGKGVNAVKSRVMRFGIELEQFIHIPKTTNFGASFHEAAGELLEKKKQLALEDSKQTNPNPRLSHPEVLKLLADMLVISWKQWNERNDAKFFNLNEWTRKAYRKHGLCNAVNDDNECNPLREWTVVLDTSLSSSPTEISSFSKVGIEFVSPVMYVGPDDYWYKPARYSIEMFYYFLTIRCGIELIMDRPGWPSEEIEQPRTSTHVHVSPPQASLNEEDPEEWTLSRTQQMAASVLFWEPAVRALLPKYRWANSFSREFRDSHFKSEWGVPGFGGNGGAEGSPTVLNQVLTKIKGTESIQALKKLMNPGTLPEFSRQFGWNFLNLPNAEEKNKKGTIEFRRGGQALNAAEAAKYMELATGLALAACSFGDPAQLMEFFHDGQNLKVGELYVFITSAIVAKPVLLPGEVSKSAFKAGWVYPELQKIFSGPIRNRPVSDFRVLKYPPRWDKPDEGDDDEVSVEEIDSTSLV